MSEKKLLLAISRILILILLFFTVISKAQKNNPICPQSSCGNIRNISFPFRLRGDPQSCGYNDPIFELECRNNQTLVLNIRRRQYYFVQEINYKDSSIRLVHPDINRGNLSSCPLHHSRDISQLTMVTRTETRDHWLAHVVFIQCLNPISSSKYVEAPLCTGNTNNSSSITIFSNSSKIYSYVILGDDDSLDISDLEESCAVNMVIPASTRGPMSNISSWAGIHDVLDYGFELLWHRVLCGECWRTNGYCSVQGNLFICTGSSSCVNSPIQLRFECMRNYWRWQLELHRNKLELSAWIAVALRFLCGFLFLVVLVVRKWRKRHLSMDETIEEFLQGQNNLTPIKYTYSEIKKMTNNFSQKLGEGGYGTVYKGKLRSGPFIAVKVMGQSISSEQEFISEVGTIGLIHHVNIVQLIGFCFKGPKCALVYEYLPNGSLDRYIFSQQGIDTLALRYEKMYEIALGVACGVDYLHRGCDVQILHFDIKPHNILLDENFNPKISDFRLAKLYPSDGGSIVNLTAARGTIGYMAPEMFYKNIGGVSYKADVYSFGMLLMEMAGRRKNMNPFADDVGQIYFPSWAYDQLHEGKEIEISDASEEERKIVRRIIVVALWCIQMKPSDRPRMNRVVEMLEGDEELSLPLKPFVAAREIAEDNHGMS